MTRMLLFFCITVVGCGSQTEAPPTPGSQNQITPELFDFSVSARDAKDAQTAQQFWATKLGREIVEENSLGMKMVLIPPGKYQIGSPSDEPKHEADEQLREVEITKPFYIGMYEVTQSEVQKLLPEHLSVFRQLKDMDTQRFPAEWITFAEATEFCEKLSEKEGRTYRLPTEREWEYACRAGTTTPFSFGTQLNGDNANCYGEDPYGTSVKGEYLGRPTTVGSYKANPFGLFDMHGNVWEMCNVQPVEEGVERVTRGGGWSGGAYWCRSANRSSWREDSPTDHDGFRIVMEL